MQRFPTFNSHQSPNESDSPKAMEIDGCDIADVCESMSISSPLKSNQTESATDHSHNSTNFIEDSQIEGKPRVSLSRRVLGSVSEAFADIDETTMRRIAMFPYMISGYIQVCFNIAFPAFFFYWMYSFGQSIHSDVEKKVQLFSEDVMEQIAKCSRDYRENRCDPSTRVPALFAACQSWEECMARDPHLVAKRSGISAEIFGETINSFFNVLSWKTIFSLLILAVGVCVIFNLTVPKHSPPTERPPKHITARLMNTPTRRVRRF